MKIVINVTFGGFSIPEALLSPEALAQKDLPYGENRDQYLKEMYPDNLKRNDPEFVAKIEALTEEQRGDLRVEEIPDGCHWLLVEYDGAERVYYSESPIYLA